MKQIPDEKSLHLQHYKQICEKLADDPFARFLGIRLVDLGPGTATAEVEVDGRLLNAHGTTHGAVIFALADVVFAAASNSYGKVSVALSMNIGFLAASGFGARLRATAIEEKKGNRTAWYRITVESDTEVVALLDALAYRKSEYIIPIEE
ncbi:acyl-CoA thioesterase [Aneurinibacillus soli]|uniref:Acyl-coenzyme A thioesterase PaaI n=1 Tax=Aneurinibacillus soli TaxID=1500254 RepID=A0A0U4ND38_9BACL|nr:hotdog fold thioesterase [Aneurinibacillus soli]PYE60948.1 acyl-CoA thioesterase [Aneurinibacillus soli]BAU26852.1 Acyl-coenzyme A thioesterase PaaI [Aneurinibacillus soli]